MHQKAFQRIAVIISTTVAMITTALAGLVATASTADAATTYSINVAGVVSCSGASVQGVYVYSMGGGSGFASWSPLPGNQVAQYSFTIVLSSAGTNVQLRVGCGGTRAKWENTALAPQVAVHNPPPMAGHPYPTWLNVDCSGSACSFPRLPGGWDTNPGTLTPNRFAPGNCTWGAAARWRDLTDTYPNWSGNGAQWGTAAAAAGYTTKRDVPRLGSVISKNPGSGDGHVFMVTGLSVVNEKTVMQVYDMNGDGTGRGTERWDFTYGAFDPATMTAIVPPYLPEGDTNNDWRINALDVSRVLNKDGTNDWRSDINDDGTVGAADSAMLNAWYAW